MYGLLTFVTDFITDFITDFYQIKVSYKVHNMYIKSVTKVNNPYMTPALILAKG